ncbi:hypothetical protein COCSUDRAFT_33625 [Coccomyxa subellipsoidea C-169]|uniref:Uncharacterized protein n=1 Tax=Coccomyxa subellipsoidea (strain C-169) TaxID=574566 RepID=I0YUH4_COCSC|nr:hypothetical protein COCSUDRAFT_33625 [Coccomyxa subellipsoidea C-169]EIE22043.1 hypothetical protein COCSUDRAFT_33625 [Coccomyxa subellipsoidea C-169]|eukprot:XP_005646587.1 hypothetical protein COCSUDRAFT_33625 [Coccomyxa subellipsoidea C-169]
MWTSLQIAGNQSCNACRPRHTWPRCCQDKAHMQSEACGLQRLPKSTKLKLHMSGQLSVRQVQHFIFDPNQVMHNWIYLPL